MRVCGWLALCVWLRLWELTRVDGQALEAEAWCRPDIVADSLAALLPAAGLE